jgi:hypothetical protein
VTTETITLIIAIWGALLSTLAIGWNLYRDLMDKGRLRVNCYFGMIVQEGVGIEKENVLFWNITNIGRKPVVLTQMGGRFKDNYFVLKQHVTLPRTLQPGEFVTGYMEDFSIMEGKDVKTLTAIDSIGRIYKAPRKQVREVKKDLKDVLSGAKTTRKQ